MKIVSLVPSWTETLIRCHLPVVGRTRFCIHPIDQVSGIPILGGTKNIDMSLLKKIDPDWVILDQEENPKSMAEECPAPWISTHVTDWMHMISEMRRLAGIFQSQHLLDWALRAENIERLIKQTNRSFDLKAGFPGLMQLNSEYQRSTLVEYVIWKNPWMTVGDGTYISSVLDMMKAPRANHFEKYPVIESLNQDGSVFYLFSSEPYPFHKKNEETRAYPSAVVDGEGFSWFGCRGIEFMERYFQWLSKSQDESAPL